MAELPWMVTAFADLGEHEIKGPKHNPKIVQYFADVGHKEVRDDETAWCAAFVGSNLVRNGMKAAGIGARTYEPWGLYLKRPAYGCIAVKRRASGPTWGGHVGFVVAANNAQVWLLGGNQGDQVSVAAFPREMFTAFRWPSEYALPAPPMALPMAYAKPAASAVSEA